MTRDTFEKLVVWYRKLNKSKLRQLTLALAGLFMISLGIGLMFIHAGVIAGGISLIVVNVGWEVERR